MVEEETLEQAEQLPRTRPPPVHRWMSELANLREHLRHCIVRVRDEEGIRHLRFLFAIMKPSALIAFVELSM